MRLILTRDDKFHDDESICYLGNWCIDYNQDLDKIKSAEKLTLPDPFLNQEDLTASYQYLKKVDGYLFPQLCQILNTMHHVKHAERFWRITVGYWWIEFLQMLYTRYRYIQSAANLYPQADVYISNYLCDSAPYDGCDFAALTSLDIYNLQLFSQIISYLNLFNSKAISPSAWDKLKTLPPLKETKKNILKKLFYLLGRRNRYYLTSTYLNRTALCRINIKLKQFPLLIESPRFIFSNNRDIQLEWRKKSIQLTGREEFEKLVASLLPQYLPKVYGEDFAQLLKASLKYFPKKTNCILTAAAFANNEAFKLFAAEQSEKHDTPYIIAQHGGCYGTAAWHHCEEYERNIADCYLTYGWQDDNDNKIKPFIANRFKKNNHQVIGKQHGNVILFLTTSSRYPRMLLSTIEGPAFAHYLKEQSIFLNNLPKHIQKRLLLKTYQFDNGWHEASYIAKQSYPINVIQKQISFEKMAKNSSLVICSYNGTPHLEAMALNVPTLLFWNPKYFPLRANAKTIHQKLYEVGILHYDPKSAANKLKEIFNHTLEWWQQSEIQNIRNDFCKQYAATTTDFTTEWEQVIIQLIQN